MALFCQRCGTENQDSANFCLKCGNQMRPDAGQVPQQYQQPQQPTYYQQPPPSTGGSLKDTFVHSAASGAGSYAGCCCMNALTNLLCDACE